MNNLKAEAIKFITAQDWINAKTWENTHPHEYLVRSKIEDKKGLEKLLKYMNENFYMRKFYSKEYRNTKLEGYRYWIMEGINNPNELIINRKKLNSLSS